MRELIASSETGQGFASYSSIAWSTEGGDVTVGVIGVVGVDVMVVLLFVCYSVGCVVSRNK